MNLFESIEQLAKQKGLSFVVIGGLAVIEHGYPRTTTDFDLLVVTDSREPWHELLLSLGYKLTNEKGTFRQYAAGEIGPMPVDLMFVNKPTFAGIQSAARTVTIEGARLPFVSLEHLLMLKLHALKYSHLGRFLKDFDDVIRLVEVNKIDLRSPLIRDLFLKYGNADLYGKICRAGEAG